MSLSLLTRAVYDDTNIEQLAQLAKRVGEQMRLLSEQDACCTII